VSHTQLLIDASATIMAKHGVRVDQFRAVDHPIATGVHPDMRQHGWDVDAWPELFGRVLAADILVIAGPIWLGDNSSETKKIIERLYAHSGELNDRGRWLYYGKVGGCLITGNEDGIKHCASNGCTACSTSGTAWLRSRTPAGSAKPDRARATATCSRTARARGWTTSSPSATPCSDLEPAAPGQDAEHGGRVPRLRQPAPGMGCGCPLRLPESRIPIVGPAPSPREQSRGVV
jgi:multimeric flavodoxin WrbA